MCKEERGRGADVTSLFGGYIQRSVVRGVCAAWVSLVCMGLLCLGAVCVGGGGGCSGPAESLSK